MSKAFQYIRRKSRNSFRRSSTSERQEGRLPGSSTDRNDTGSSREDSESLKVPKLDRKRSWRQKLQKHSSPSPTRPEVKGPSNSEDFWQRHFSVEIEVPWVEFKEAFRDDYGEFIEQRPHWVFALLQEEVFEGKAVIHKSYYRKFCQPSEDPDAIWFNLKSLISAKIFRESLLDSLNF